MDSDITACQGEPVSWERHRVSPVTTHIAERLDARGGRETVIANAWIYDGTGRPGFHGEVAFDDSGIHGVARTAGFSCRTGDDVIDAAGLALAPGFIDAHTHDDRILIDSPSMEAKTSQGVTTVVIGNCGISLVPVTFAAAPPPPMNLLGGRDVFAFPTMAVYAEALRSARPCVNVVALIGHSALRLAVMDDITRRADADEIDAMHRLLAQAMDEGASGFSSGLFYPTNQAADASEVAAVASAAQGGTYATHMRDEADGVLESIRESAATAAAAGLPLVISHHKCAGPANWGRTRETLPCMTAAAASQPVHCDVYPYTAGSTNLRADLVTGDYRIMMTWSQPFPDLSGRDLSSIAEEWDVSLEDAARRLDPAGAIYFQMDEDDVRRVLAFELSIIGSDGLPHDDHPHPRLWGTFPRVIGHYARDIGLFGVETAIHKMTGRAADVFGLVDRGRLKPGHAADLVLFDQETIIDRATWKEPRRPAEGIVAVLVNGRLASAGGQATGGGNGRLLTGRNPIRPVES